MTITLQIGNTDNKLTQQEWARFVEDVNFSILTLGTVYFFGGPPNYLQYQNVCWVFETSEDNLPDLKENITQIRKQYSQDSAAWTEGKTEFI